MEKELGKGNNTLKLMLAIFVIISLALGGFIFYDKVLKKEENVLPKPVEKNNIDNFQKNDESKITYFTGITLGEYDKEVTLNGKKMKLRKDNENALYINGKKVDNVGVNENAYISDYFILFEGLCQSSCYSKALNHEGKIVDVSNEPSGAYTSVDNVHFENGKIIADVIESQEESDGNGNNLETRWNIEYVYENNKVVAKKIN